MSEQKMPTVGALLAAETWAAAGHLNLEQLAIAFDEFAAEQIAAAIEARAPSDTS